MNRFPVAAVQFRVGADKKANLELAESLIREAAGRGARMVALPELFNWGGRPDAEIEAGETVPGPTTDLLAALARELEIYLVGGSILERVEGQEKVFNTALFFDPTGKLVDTYRKLHLFDVELGDLGSLRESKYRASGSEAVVVDSAHATIGLALCYDLRFPELFRRLVDDGAKIVFLPSAFVFATGAVHWEPLIRARAIENQVYIVAPNQCGRGASGVVNYGNSMIVDPWGTILARRGDGAGIVMADIDLEYLERIRRELPCLDHRVLRG